MQESPPIPSRKAPNLPKGRVSIPNARYFLTINTKGRKPGLNTPKISEQIKRALRELHASREIELFCGTIMPDHIHLVIRLGRKLSLPQVVRKFKFLTTQYLRIANLMWQHNYFDHYVRLKESLESYALYVFLNPYRKELISLDDSWQGWFLHREFRPKFLESLSDGEYPHKEWLKNAKNLEDTISAGKSLNGTQNLRAASK